MDEVLLNLCFYLSLQGASVNPTVLKRDIDMGGWDQSDVYAKVPAALGYKTKIIPLTRETAVSQPLLIDHARLGPCVLLRAENSTLHIFQARLPATPQILSEADFYEGFAGHAKILEKKLKATRIFEILRTYCTGRVLAAIICSSLLVQVFAIAIPLFSQLLIDKVLVRQNISALYVFGSLMALMVIVEFLFACIRVRITISTGKKIDAAISYSVYQSIIEKPLLFFQTNRVGGLVNFAKKASVCTPLINSGTIFNSLDMVFTIVFFAIMIGYSLELSLMCALIVVMLSGFNFYAQNLKDGKPSEHDPSVELTEALHGIESIKLARREGLTLKKIEKGIVAQAKSQARSSLRANLLLSLNMCMQRMGMLATLWVGAVFVMDGKMSMGQLIAFQMFSSRVFHPAARMAYTIKELRAAFKDLMDFSAKIHRARSEDRHHFKSFERLEVRRLCFSHHESPEILSNLNLTVGKSEKIGILGVSGSGKSTLLRLVVGLYGPTKGGVFINGVDVRRLNEALVRTRIVLVPQQSSLFKGTIGENVGPYGFTAFNDDLIKYAKILEIDQFVDMNPEGYERTVAEAGANFSGGQRQKLCLLRALLMQPDVLLLDESTSALDEAAELRIHRNLIEAFPALTIITISHRPNSLESYDTTYSLANGALHNMSIQQICAAAS